MKLHYALLSMVHKIFNGHKNQQNFLQLPTIFQRNYYRPPVLNPPPPPIFLTTTLKCLPSFYHQILNHRFCLIDFPLIGKLSKINPCLDATESFPSQAPQHFPSFSLQIIAHFLSDRANITNQVETIIYSRVQILRLDGQTVGKTGSM